MEPMLHLRRGNRILRLQPPNRVRACRPPSFIDGTKCAEGGTTCEGRLSDCPTCLWPYCDLHVENHIDGYAFPVDAWKQTRVAVWQNAAAFGAKEGLRGQLWHSPNERLMDLRLAGQIVEPKPPVRIEFCRAPSSGTATAPCAFRNANCNGDLQKCFKCGFSHCAKHSPGHRKRFALPRKMWRAILNSYDYQLREAAKNPRRGVKVRPPPFEVS